MAGKSYVLFGALALVALLAFLNACSSESNSGDETLDDAWNIPSVACPEGNLFSRAPIELSDVTSVSPLGSLIPPGHTFPTAHLYIYVMDPEDAEDVIATLYSPGDMHLTQVVYNYNEPSGDRGEVVNYHMHFNVCDDVKLYFINVRSITHPGIVAKMEGDSCPSSGADQNYAQCSIPIYDGVAIAAGDVLGTVGDADVATGVDVGVRDYRQPTGRSAFANPDRWCSEIIDDILITQHCYSACFFDYLDGAVAEPYLDLVKSRGVTRTAEPRCGWIYHDVEGSAQGYWFPTAEVSTSEVDNLFIGPNDIEPSLDSFSAGERIPDLDSNVYHFHPQSSGMVNLSFDLITDSQTYCFDELYNSIQSAINESADSNLDFIILLKMSDDAQEVTVEKQDDPMGCGAGPWAFTSNAVTFYR